MATIKRMTDMRRTDAEKAQSMLDASVPTPMIEDYPYGLKLCLTDEELEKLDLDSECEVGDLIHINAMAVVTSCSETKINGKTSCRIDLTLTHMGIEDEGSETDED